MVPCPWWEIALLLIKCLIPKQTKIQVKNLCLIPKVDFFLFLTLIQKVFTDDVIFPWFKKKKKSTSLA